MALDLGNVGDGLPKGAIVIDIDAIINKINAEQSGTDVNGVKVITLPSGFLTGSAGSTGSASSVSIVTIVLVVILGFVLLKPKRSRA